MVIKTIKRPFASNDIEVTVPKNAEILGIAQKLFPTLLGNFPLLGGIFPDIWAISQKDFPLFGRLQGLRAKRDCLSDVGAHVSDRRDDGTHGRTFTALVYNGVSIGLWHTILLNLKNHVKTGGLAGRVRAARSDKKIETIETRVILIWNMQHSQDNGSDTSVGFEVSKATVIKINASKFKVVAVNSNWRSGGVNVERFESQR